MKTQKFNFNRRALIFAMSSILALGAFSANSYGATDTADLNVSATITNTCTITTDPLSFGEYDTSGGNALVNGVGTVNTICTKDSPAAKITLNQGVNPDNGSSDDVPLRRMADGAGNYLSYALYQDAGHTNVWGNTAVAGKDTAVGTGAITSLDVYGQIPAGQNVPAGAYTDTVVATVTW